MKQHTEKKMLLIAPVFMGYYEKIIKEAELLGYSVDYVCDAPSNSNISKALGRVNRKLIENSTRRYFKNEVLEKIGGKKYSKVLMVAAMSCSLTPDMIKTIRDMNAKAEFAIYQWDGEDNIPFVRNIHCFFDRIYTFDRKDCEKNEKYAFLPLFYTEKYEKVRNSNTPQKYDCLYVGTAHPKKFKEINEMSAALKDVFKSQMIYHYMPSKLKYLYHKILSPEYQGVKLNNFQYSKLNEDELVELYTVSKCILDAPQKGQMGLTMRTIEALGAGRKLITTNSDIINYDFFRKSNILVYESNVDFNSDFFIHPYEELPKEIYEKYSLRNWLKTVLNHVKED